MKQQTKRTYSRNTNDLKPKIVYPKNFEIDIEPKLAADLSYFIKQELGYYNSLIDLLSPRLRAYPKDILNIKEREKSLWDSCAEYAIDPQKLLDQPFETWPKHLHHMHHMLYDINEKIKISPAHINICSIASTPARLHAVVRKAIASEILKYMVNQADILLSAVKTDVMRAPMQMLQTHTIDTKRHLQIPKSLIKITYNESENSSDISIPYSKTAITVPYYDLRPVAFKLLIIRAPHPTSTNQKWQLDFRDSPAAYLLSITDPVERKRR
jgi:hypothetical protein